VVDRKKSCIQAILQRLYKKAASAAFLLFVRQHTLNKE
jgi:hypothetical protein